MMNAAMSQIRSGRGSGLDEEGAKLYDHRVITRIWRYATPYKQLIGLSLFSLLVYTGATVAIPALIALGIDEFIQQGNPQGLNMLAALFGALLVVHFISNYYHQLLLTKASQHAIYDLREDLFNHLQRLPLGFHSRHKAGSVMSRAQNDVYQLQEFLDIVVSSIGDFLSLIGIVTIMLVFDWQLTLTSLAALPVLIYIIYLWQRHARPSYLRVRVAIGRVNATLAENLTGVRVVQSMNRQESNLKAFKELNRAHLEANLKAGRLSASLMPTVELFMALALAAVIVFGGQMVLTGAITAGVLVQFSLYIMRFFDPIRSMAMQLTQLQRAMASGSRVFDLLDVEPELQDVVHAVEMPPIKGHVHYEKVSFAYKGGQPILQEIDLEIPPGQTLALVGRTGAGKTTMAALLSRFYDVTAGRLAVDGYDVRHVKRRSLAEQMGVVLQEPFLYSDTVLENIRYNHPEASEVAVERAAKAVGIHQYILSLPNGYETRLEERGGNLSIGQRQLISFARALVADPRIIILDEATANVDTETEQAIQQAIATLLKGRTAVVIAHRLSTIRNADQIVVMRQGRIAERGTHEELVAGGGLYAKQYALHQGRTPSDTPASQR